jgi:hypothetical protein
MLNTYDVDSLLKPLSKNNPYLDSKNYKPFSKTAISNIHNTINIGNSLFNNKNLLSNFNNSVDTEYLKTKNYNPYFDLIKNNNFIHQMDNISSYFDANVNISTESLGSEIPVSEYLNLDVNSRSGFFY